MNAIFGLCAAAVLLLLLDLRLLRRAKSGLAVLAYDNIGTPPKNCRLKHLWISEKKFERQILFLIGKKFKFICANDLERNDISENSVLITFNCGYENFYTNALPILREFKIRPLVFLTAEGIDSYNFWHNPKNGPWQNMLSRGQIKELQIHSLADFGSNCLTDINMSEAKADIVENQIKESAARLQKLYKIKPDFFAYPQATSAVTEVMRAHAQETY
ncbi:MAG: polysaccharide deacetylase family protein, partial [Elusimicrobiota bacterium]|nr:polysaccharide deacetylase family protein [Elusimicrobiota bacterium]